MAKPSMRKPPRKTTTHLGTYGERVARERAARRRAARDRAEREPADRKSTERELATPHREPALDDEPAAGPDVVSGPEVVEIPQSDLANELSVLAALIMSGLVRSHPEAKRRFREDGIIVNDKPVLSDKAKLRLSDVSPDGLIKLALGAGRHVFLRPA
ncbi:MAG: hypothetical protein AB7L90_16625 [Hyphomicrobiaceae bacterium]